MELNQLNHFRTVAKLENVTKAARELFVSQPNLSTSISRLESSLGVQLFSRSKGRIQLDGKRRNLPPSRQPHLSGAGHRSGGDPTRERVSGRTSINAAASFSRILPALFSHYYLDYGLLPTTQMVLSDKGIENGLLAHTIDLAVVCDWMEGEKIVWEPADTIPVVALMKQDNHFANRRSCSLEDFRQAHFICNELFLSRSTLLNLCQKAGFVPNIVRTSNEQEWFDERTFDFGRNIVLCPVHRLPELMGEGNLDLRAVPLDDYFAQITVGIARSLAPHLHPDYGGILSLHPSGAGQHPDGAVRGRTADHGPAARLLTATHRK